jgi:hypothetical protein
MESNKKVARNEGNRLHLADDIIERAIAAVGSVSAILTQSDIANRLLARPEPQVKNSCERLRNP